MTTSWEQGQLKPYNRDNFPIAGVLEDVTAAVRESGMDYIEAYALTMGELKQVSQDRELSVDLSNYSTYVRTAVTSGGHSWVPAIADQGPAAVVKANTDTSREIFRRLEAKGDIGALDTLLPTDLGYTGWNQFGFIGYFDLGIIRPDLEELAKRPLGFKYLEKQIGLALDRHEVDLTRMADAGLDNEARRPEYLKVAHAFADLCRSGKFGCVPVRRMIGFVDTKFSLGSDGEKTLGENVGAEQFGVTAVKACTVRDLETSRLKEDLTVIATNGGQSLVAESGTILTITRTA